MTFLIITVATLVCTSSRPNIIIIYPDNQDLLLGSTGAEYMPILNSHIIDNGITMHNAFVSTPLCCPSRGELLSGRYYHNIGPPYPPDGTCILYLLSFLLLFHYNYSRTIFRYAYFSMGTSIWRQHIISNYA